MRKKIFLLFALLCAVAQGAWAQISFPIVYDDVWDGVTTTRPTYYESYGGVKEVVVINKASELAYLRDHFEDETDYGAGEHYYSQNYYLNANLDMGDKTWTPFPHTTDGGDGGYMGTFYGNNHTIRIVIKDARDNYQGLFGRLWYGTVQDLHVTGNISCERSRFVGGIAGLGYSANVRNCWVSADISSQWREPSSAYTACVGGILGDFYHSRGSGEQVMEYCCMTGNVLNDDASVGGLVGWKEASTYVRHCTFYGTRYSVHDQHDVFFGKYVVNWTSDEHEDLHDNFTDGELSAHLASFSGNDLYRYAVQNPFAVNVRNAGPGTLVANADRTRPGQTVTLTKTSGNGVASIFIRDADNTPVAVSGNETDGWTFTMPRRDVNVTATFYNDDGSIPDNGLPTVDVWDGTAETKPTYLDESTHTIHIQTAAQIVYIRNHWKDEATSDDWCYYECNYALDTDLDMTVKSWKPFGSDAYNGTFNGNGHTIRLKIENTSDNYQGLFETIDGHGTVENLHVAGSINVGKARMVGGIAGNNLGTITNCWVSANVESSHYSTYDADLGGICGWNEDVGTIEYCCMTGNVTNTGGNSGVGGIAGSNDGSIKHCTFYGDVSVNHDQDNKYVGDQDKTLENCYDGFNQSEWDTANSNGKTMYRYAIKYPWAIHITTVGKGSVTVSCYGEDNVPGACCNKEVTLTTPAGLTAEVSVTDADGNGHQVFGNSATGFTFYMPKCDVYVRVVFSVPDWPRQGNGTSDSPYLITSADDWNEFALSVNAGNTHSGRYVRMTEDISTWMMAGASADFSFQGTFDGSGHTLTFNYSTAVAVTAPFRYTRNAVIRNLGVEGTITTGAMCAAGIVGDASGSLNLIACRSGMAISSSRPDIDAHGGLVASNSGTVAIHGCVFDGSLAATVTHTTPYGTTYCGGFVGMCNENTSTTITNSLVKPVSVSKGMINSTFVGLKDATDTVTLTNCYFVDTANLPTDQGTRAVAATAPTGLSNLVQDYGMLKAYGHGILYNGTYYGASTTVSLADKSDNTATISTNDGYVADVTLAERTLYKDGAWNTICLPFDYSLLKFSGVEARTLTSASISGTTLSLTFGDPVDELMAGVPYIIKWAEGDNVVSPVFSSVVIDKTARSYDNGESGDTRVRFLGTYKSMPFDATDKSVLLMGSANTLYFPTTGAGLGAQRAYFKIGEDGGSPAQVKSFRIDFGDGETTGIVSMEYGKWNMENDGWYSLDGRRLDGKPSRAGVYIYNGIKRVIK